MPRTTLSISTLLTLCLCSAGAFAQDEDSTPPVPEPGAGPGGARLDPPAPPAPPPGPTLSATAAATMPDVPPRPPDVPAEVEATGQEVDVAWGIYHDAFLDTVTGREEKARRELQRLREQHPKHPASLLAASLLMRMDEVDFGTKERDAHFGSRRPSGLARAELATTQTLAGIAMGGWVCGLTECDDGRVIVSVLTLGAAAGLSGSLILTDSEGITPGRALAVNTGTAWGLYNGAMMAAIADGDGPGVFGALLAGQIIGTAGGVAIAAFSDPTAGDISMASSGGLWMGNLMFMLNGITDFEMFDGSGDLASILVMSDIGVLGGALLRVFDVLQMSRSRALLIDSGGVMGTLLGMGLAVLVRGGDITAPTLFGPGLVGMLGGLTGTFFLTRDWDTPDVDMNLAVVPTQDGGLTVGLGGRF